MFRYSPAIYYSAPGAPDGGAPVAPAPTQPQSQPQPGAPGQGPDQGLSPQFRQQYFPNVPDDQWSALEPHLSGVNKHVTQLEQRYAPLKGYTPEAVQGLSEFAAAFDRDPVGQLLRLATVLQQRGIVDQDLDLEYLGNAMRGQYPEEDDDTGNGNGVFPGGPADPRDQQIAQLSQQVEQLTNLFTQQQQSTRQRTEDAAIKRQTNELKQQLMGAGYPEEALTEESLLATYIAHRGNIAKAVEAATGTRNALLKGFTADPEHQRQQQQQRDLDLPKGSPKAKPRPSAQSRRGRGMFAGVEGAAEQALRAADKE